MGPKYTWNNKRDGRQFSQKGLDRAFANKEWCLQYNSMEVSVLAAISSYHSPIMVQIKKSYALKPKRGFRFEASWAKHKDYKAIIKQVWLVKENRFDHQGNFQKKFNKCRIKLVDWKKSNYGQEEDLIKQKSKQLLDLQGGRGALAMGRNLQNLAGFVFPYGARGSKVEVAGKRELAQTWRQKYQIFPRLC